MNTSKIIAAAALAVLAAAGAHAESYDGVQQLKIGNSRADVAAQGNAAARSGNVYGDVQSSAAIVRPSAFDRASVHAEAVAAAHAPNQNLDPRAFANSEVPPQYQAGQPAGRRAGL